MMGWKMEDEKCEKARLYQYQHSTIGSFLFSVFHNMNDWGDLDV